jgi:serine/threonine protein kinase
MEVTLAIEQGPSPSSSFCFGPDQEVVVGQGPGVQLALRDPALAPRHLALLLRGDTLQVSDFGGTTLNGQPIPLNVPTEAYSGDTLELGAHVLRVTVLGRRAKRRPDAGHRVASDEEFEIVRPLGEGAAGQVFEARWKARANTSVALKLLREQITPGSPDHERFLRERMASRIESPYVVQVYEARVEPKRTFLILEYVPGPSLDAVLADGPARDIATALRLAEDVCRALCAAARAGIVHRDVKPANILLSPQGMAKLCDFGIAKGLRDQVASLTASGLGLGTMAYMPPEQIAEAKHVKPSADAYSLGATLYHMLAGRPPFSPNNVPELLATMEQAPAPIASLRSDCPPELAELVMGLLAKAHTKRPSLRKTLKALVAIRAARYPEARFDHVFPAAI